MTDAIYVMVKGLWLIAAVVLLVAVGDEVRALWRDKP